MATEKILNTKVLLRYDTLAHWQATDKVNAGANYLPKKGEACVYEIPTGASVDGVKNPPAIMIKVGDGTNKISALPWTAATAADVYAWAKKSGIEIEEGTGDYITGLSWNSITNKIVVAKASFDNSGNVKFSKTEAGNVKATVSISDVKVDNALHAETADSATEAGKATNDGAGNNIVDTYATKAEIEANRNLWTQDTVTKVTDDKQAIKVSTTDTLFEGSDITYIVELKINNSTPGNVTLTQDANGLKANTTPEAIGAQPAGNYKTKQAVVSTPTANGNATAFIDTISQNENGEITITKKNITAADLGLGNALHFLGTSTTEITDGGTQKPTIDGSQKTPKAGDVVLYGSQEFIYNSSNKWELFGDEGSYALKTITVTGNDGLTGGGDLAANRTIGIADGGVTTTKIADGAVTKAKLDGNVLGEIGDKTVKSYVDDAIAGVTGGKVEKAEKDGEGNVITETYKVKQSAVVDPTASGKSLTFIDAISQNTEGVITATKKEVNLDAYALKTDIPEIPNIEITETKGVLGSAGTIFVSGKLVEDTVTGHTISQPMFGLTQMGDIEFVTAEQTVEDKEGHTTTGVAFTIKDKAVTAEKTAAYTTENIDGTHTASTEVWVLYGGSATENI